MNPSILSQIDWSGLAIAFGHWLGALAAAKGAEKALEIPFERLKKQGEGNLAEALRQGKYGAVQEVLDAAKWPAVMKYETKEERDTALAVLKAMAEDSESEALRNQFAEQVKKSFLARTQVRPDTKALARTYGAAHGRAPSQKVVAEILERFFDKVREGLLLREEFGFLREYEQLQVMRDMRDLQTDQLTETKRHTDLLQKAVEERTVRWRSDPDTYPIPPPDRPPRLSKLVERTKYAEQLAVELASSHIAIISGLPGTGKSILAGHVANAQFGDSKYFWHSFAAGQDITSCVIRLVQFLGWHEVVPRWQTRQILKYVYADPTEAEDKRRSTDKTIDVLRLILSLLREKDYLLCLDNAHLIEQDHLAPTFLDLLERECRGGGIAALLISDGAMSLSLTVQPLKLDGFSVDETKSLCKLQGLTMSEKLIEELHRKTGGNPRLLTSAYLALSRTIDIAKQIDELPEDVIDFSSLGKKVDEGLKQEPQLIEVMTALSLLLENPEIAGVSVSAVEVLVNRKDTPRLLLGLFDRSLVRRHGTGSATTYTLDRPLRTYYYGLLGSRSMRLHGTAGTYYEQEGQMLTAAYHFMEAGELERAAKLIASNMEALINQGKAAGVESFLKSFPIRKVSWDLQIELEEAKGDLQVLHGSYDDALSVYHGALRRARIHQPLNKIVLARLHRNIGKCHERKDELDIALKSYEDGLTLLSDSPTSIEAARLHLGISVVHYANKAYDRTIKECADALAIAEVYDQEDWTRVQAGLHNIMGLAYRRQRKYDKAIEHFAASIELFNAVRDLLGMAKALDNRGVAYYEQSDPDKAAADIRASQQLLEKAAEDMQESSQLFGGIGSQYDIAGTHNNIGMVFYQQGRLDDAVLEYTKALDILKPMGVKSKTADCYYNLGEASLGLARRSSKAHDNEKAGGYLYDVVRYFADGIKYFRDLHDTGALDDIGELLTEAHDLAHEIGNEHAAEAIQALRLQIGN